MDHWQDKEFIKELDRRTKSFLDGTSKGYTLQEVQANAIKALADKKRLKDSMTLHEAIERVLMNSSRSMTTIEIANALNENKWYQKKDSSLITAFQIHGRTRNYPQLFKRDGATVSLLSSSDSYIKSKRSQKHKAKKIIKDKDEVYVVNLCDNILKSNSLRQHRFYFLLGDVSPKTGRSIKLPVDAYYPELNLVIEYCERQHSESVSFFDKQNKITASGVHRGEQRKIYDLRRKEVLPKHGITVIEIPYSDFKHTSQKRIIRDEPYDKSVITRILKNYIKQ